MIWESGRGIRRVGDWTYDPANSRDRRSLLEDAVDGEYEPAKISAPYR